MCLNITFFSKEGRCNMTTYTTHQQFPHTEASGCYLKHDSSSKGILNQGWGDFLLEKTGLSLLSCRHRCLRRRAGTPASQLLFSSLLSFSSSPPSSPLLLPPCPSFSPVCKANCSLVPPVHTVTLEVGTGVKNKLQIRVLCSHRR